MVQEQIAIRPVIRCKTCGLVQFVRQSGRCSRCRGVDAEISGQGTPPQPTPSTPIHSRLGLFVIQTRGDLGLSQKQLAAQMGTSRTYVSKLEAGAVVPTIATLERLAHAVNMDLSEVFVRLARRTDARRYGELLRRN
jgi:ribosome-binding protein aMBF1 (putative translation factor)